MKKLIFAIATVVSLQAGAQSLLFSPGDGGFIARSRAFEISHVPAGTFDQGRRAALMQGVQAPAESAERALWQQAVGAYLLNNTDAGVLLNAYLDRYPASSQALQARLALANLLFDAGSYQNALAAYSKISPSRLDAATAADLGYHQGYCYLMIGEYDNATEQFTLLGGDPEYANAATFYRGYIAYAQGKYGEALQLMRQVKTTDMPGAAAPYYIMEMEYNAGNNNQALELAQKLLKRPTVAGFSVECNRVAGEALYNLGNTTSAIPYLWEYAATASNPSPAAYYILGISEFDAGHIDDAIKLLQKAITDDDAMAQSAYLYLGQAYMQRGDKDSALMAFRNAYQLNHDRAVSETALYNYAVAKADGGRVPFGSSVSLFEDFLRQFPDSRYAPQVEQYVITGYMTDNDYESALAAINRVKNPTHKVLTAKQRVLFVTGSREYEAGHLNTAESRLNQVVEMGTGYDASILSQSRLWLADCQYSRGDYDDAATNYLAYLEAYPTGANAALARYNLGYTRFDQGRYADAATNFTRAIRDASGEPSWLFDAWNRLADCRYYAREFDAANAAYAKAYSLNPGAGDYALYQQALVKGMQGDHQAKIAGIDNLLSHFPQTALAAPALLEKAESQSAVGDQSGAMKTYVYLTANYAQTAAGRNGYLQMALAQLNNGERVKALETYREVIRRYPTSNEARVAADDLRRLCAADGTLAEYTAFMQSVPEAPEVTASDLEQAAFDAAESLYARTGATGRLTQYLKDYPNGASTPNATYYLAEAAWDKGDTDTAINLLNELEERYPHASITPAALLLRGEAENAVGKTERALATYTRAAESTSDPSVSHQALLGVLRTASALGRHDLTVSTADQLLGSTATTAESNDEVRYLRALALERKGNFVESDTQLSALAQNPRSLYGSMAAVALGQSLLDRGGLKSAHKVVDDFINANPPHQYWLARGFILYSDILRRQGNTFEADEYLRSLRSNYPGKEPEIRQMIDARLK